MRTSHHRYISYSSNGDANREQAILMMLTMLITMTARAMAVSIDMIIVTLVMMADHRQGKQIGFDARW